MSVNGSEKAKQRQRRKDGDVVVSANGYSYTYTTRAGMLVRTLTHHLIAETKYGRPPAADERVIFVDKDRANLDPKNIEYVKKNSPRASLLRREATLKDKIREYTAELQDVQRKLRAKDWEKSDAESASTS